MKSGRELFKDFLNREPLSRPAFIPFLRCLLSRVEGKSMKTLTADPALWSSSLVKTTELFGFDGVVAGMDFCLAAEACGCNITWEDDSPFVLPLHGKLNEEPDLSRPIQHALEVSKRLFNICRKNLTCVTTLTGPFTLSAQLFGSEKGDSHIEDIKPLIVKITEAFCKTQPDVLVFLEGRALTLEKINVTHRRIYNTLKNIASYYNIPVGIYLQDYRPESISDFSKLKMDMYVLGPSLNNDLPLPSELWGLGEGTLGLGLGLPLDDPGKAKEIIHEGMKIYHDRAEHGVFFTSLGPVTRDIDFENLHALVNEISSL